MTFAEILDQAIAMLQRRGRVTYGALKRQFHLDDAYLEDLKAEIIKAQRLAVEVVYPTAAENHYRPLPTRLIDVNQPVIRSRNAFSTPRSTLLACL
jgi:hypothetical protein